MESFPSSRRNLALRAPLKNCGGLDLRLEVQSWPQCPWRAGVRAFTLIEILIAMAIFGLVLLAIYSSWAAILRGSKAGLTAAAEAQRTRIAVRAIREALTCAQLYVENARYYWFMADTGGDFAAVSMVSRLPASFPGSGLFSNQV